ncbi:MAG: hypothetical protein HZY76_08755 [Anaerolineae bacterium]|nr:MAG: hypothetical protein HZY76_08755 [Anaerolineae bacterium]
MALIGANQRRYRGRWQHTGDRHLRLHQPGPRHVQRQPVRDQQRPRPRPGNGTDLVVVPVTLMVQGPTAVTLNTVDAAPLPLAVPLTVVPATLGLAAAAVYTLRRKK